MQSSPNRSPDADFASLPPVTDGNWLRHTVQRQPFIDPSHFGGVIEDEMF